MATYIPKISNLHLLNIGQTVKANTFNSEYMADFPHREANGRDIFRSLDALTWHRPTFATILTKIMLTYNGKAFVFPLDEGLVSNYFRSEPKEYELLARKVYIHVEAKKFTEYNLETSDPLGIRCWISGCSVRDFFSMLRYIPEIEGRLDYICGFLDEAATYISSWNNKDNRFSFDIVYNHSRNNDSSIFDAKEETGKVFFPGGYLVGNNADWFISRKLKPHFDTLGKQGSLAQSMSYFERNSTRISLTRKGAESSLIFSPPDSGYLWGSCYVDPKITELTLNEGQLTESDLALIGMAGIKDELLLDMPYDLSQTQYFQNIKRSYK